jgi:hypothetical protein
METVGIIFCITLAAIVFAVLWVAIVVVVARTGQYIYEYFSKRKYTHKRLPLWQKVHLCEHPLAPMRRALCNNTVLVRAIDINGKYTTPQIGVFEVVGRKWDLWHNGEPIIGFTAGDDIEVIWLDKFTTKKQK